MKIKKLLVLAVVLLALLSVGQLSLASGWPPLGDPGSIEVHKFHDANGNNVQDPGEEDVEGWLIRIYRSDGTGFSFVGEGFTDDNGIVTFTDLPAPTRYKAWEEKRECWEPTTPGLAEWNGGYYTVVWTTSNQTEKVEFGNVDTCAPVCQTDLIAGQDWDNPAGVVTVSNDDTNLYVTFDTTGTGWSLGETHLYVGTTPPKKSAPGRFPYSGQTDYTIPLSDFEGDTLYIAAHAVVTQGEQEETAWADNYGIPIPKGGWGMYFGYEVGGVGCFKP